MKKKILFSMFLLCVFIGTTYSQGNDFLWAHSMGNIGRDYCIQIASDPSGNSYNAGGFQYAIDFDPGPGTFNMDTNGEWGLFFQKLDNNGNFVWAKSIIQTSGYGISVYDIAVDDQGNTYAVGMFEGIVDLDPGPGTSIAIANGLTDIFILKLDSNGNLVWVKTVGGPISERPENMVIDDAGNVHITGSYHGTVDFDPGPGVFNLTAGLYNDIFVYKLDVDGNFEWAKTIASSGQPNGLGIAVDELGNVHVTGKYHGTADFDPGPGVFNLTSNGSSDAFVQKLDVDGNFVWAKTFGGSNFDYGHAVTTDAENNVLLAGQFYVTGDFDPGPNDFILTANGSGGYLVKLDPTGNFVWAKGFEPDSSTAHALYTSQLITDAENNVFMLGRYRGTYDFDPGPGTYYAYAPSTNYAGLALKLDSMGNFIKQLPLTASSDLFIWGGTLDPQDNLYLGGSYRATADFDPGSNTHYHTSAGDIDLFILKLSACETSVGIAESNTVQQTIACPNPTSGVVTLDLEDIKDATIKVLNINGQVVYQQAQVNGIHQFELTGASGVYTIEVSTATIRKYVKLIKQ